MGIRRRLSRLWEETKDGVLRGPGVDVESLKAGEIGNNDSPISVLDELNFTDVVKGETLELIGGTGADNVGGWVRMQGTDDVGTSSVQIIDQEQGVIRAAFVLVSGDEQGSNSRFADWVQTGPAAGQSVRQSREENSPAGRLYDTSDGYITLAMSSGTYDIITLAIGVQRDPN